MKEGRTEMMGLRQGNDNIASSSAWPSSTTLGNSRDGRTDVSYCNVQTLSAQSTGFTRTAGIGDECSHGHYQKSNVHDSPPPYVDTMCDYKHLPHQVNKFHSIHNTQTREAREEEAIASDNRRKYKERIKCCKRFTILAAFLYALAAVYLMQWHKKISVKTAINQEEALRNVVLVSDINNPGLYEGKLVHVVGTLTVTEPLTDPECGFSVSTVKLKRFVHDSEIYMMVKTKRGQNDSSDDQPRYYYTRKGGDILLRSNQLCVNPINTSLKRWDVKSQVQTAREVKIGAFTLGDDLKDQFNEYVYVTDKLMELSNDNAVRLIFSYAGRHGDIYSVIGKLVNGVIVPYRTRQGDEILLKRMYAVAAEEMIRMKQFDSDFEFYRSSCVLSFITIFLSIALVYYCKIHPLIPDTPTTRTMR